MKRRGKGVGSIGAEKCLVRQATDDGCGPACGEMLLRDRGFDVDQGTIADGLPLPATAEHLAARMRALSTIPWIGAFISIENGASWDFVAALTAEQVSWAALLEPGGFRATGHWVVVDDVSIEGIVTLRDPRGEVVLQPMEEFLVLWRYTVMVVEEVP